MMKKIIYPIIVSALLSGMVSCEDTTKIEKTDPNPQVEMTLNDASVFGSEVEVEYEKSLVISFQASCVSYIKATGPEGWTIKTSMDNENITVTAPLYADAQAAASGTVTLTIYDGSGESIEKSFSVSAFECEPTFSTEDLSETQKFSLGSTTYYNCEQSANVGSYRVDAPKGWTVNQTENGFSVTAPIWTPESGLDQDGIVTITPVTYSGNACEALKTSFSVHVDAKATFQFKNPGKITFDFGQTQEIEMAVAGMKSIDKVYTPQGWTVDVSELLTTGKIKVTAPSGKDDYDGYAQLALEGTQTGIEVNVPSVDNVILRIRGINCAQDMLDFREAHGAVGEFTVDMTKLTPWLVDGELTLNKDITMDRSTMHPTYNAYFIHHMYVPINGNGHTITFDYKSTAAVCAMFQHIHADVHDLNFAGCFECVNAKGVVAPLAQQNLKTDVNITNVNSSATVIASGNSSAGNAAGLIVKAESNKTLKLTNCKVTGDIYVNGSAAQCGGVMATGTSDGKAGIGLVSLNNCEFSGNFFFNKNNDVPTFNKNCRFGGIIGSQERNGEIKGCTFSGNIYMYLYGVLLFQSSGGGVGGIMGRCNAATSGYVMNTVMTDCVSSGTIHLVNPASNEYTSAYGVLIGTNLGTCTPKNCTASGSIVTE